MEPILTDEIVKFQSGLLGGVTFYSKNIFIDARYNRTLNNLYKKRSADDQTEYPEETSTFLKIYILNKEHQDLNPLPDFPDYQQPKNAAELGDLRRFNNERQLSNYIGLVPGIYQSDETSKPMGLTPRSRSSCMSVT